MNLPLACSVGGGTVPFVATVLPAGFSPEARPGVGGVVSTDPGGSTAPTDAPRPVNVHYAGAPGRWIDVVHTESPLAGPTRTITVLGGPAELGEVDGRPVVTVSVSGVPCGALSFVATGVTEAELVAFVEGLQPVG